MEAVLATIPELHGVQEQTGDDNRGVRVYNLSDELLTVTVLHDGHEIPGSGFTASKFDLGRGAWDPGSGLMTCPSTVLRISTLTGASRVSEWSRQSSACRALG